MVQLYILRHGEAGKRVPANSKDSERALTVTGEQEVKEVAQALAALKVKPDFVATSPLKRARQTAEIVAKALKVKKADFEEWNELKPEGHHQELYRRLAQFKPDSNVIVVGHEPYLSAIIGEMVFGSSSGRIILKKAGIAKVLVTSFHPRIKGELRWLLVPKHMKHMVD